MKRYRVTNVRFAEYDWGLLAVLEVGLNFSVVLHRENAEALRGALSAAEPARNGAVLAEGLVEDETGERREWTVLRGNARKVYLDGLGDSRSRSRYLSLDLGEVR